jgi:lipid-A-disaccharide synthase-like uncharacterized protein
LKIVLNAKENALDAKELTIAKIVLEKIGNKKFVIVLWVMAILGSKTIVHYAILNVDLVLTLIPAILVT